jgi:hypothetical protein
MPVSGGGARREGFEIRPACAHHVHCPYGSDSKRPGAAAKVGENVEPDEGMARKKNLDAR